MPITGCRKVVFFLKYKEGGHKKLVLLPEEYGHKLPRKIFFANKGEFTTADGAEIINKASYLILMSNLISLHIVLLNIT